MEINEQKQKQDRSLASFWHSDWQSFSSLPKDSVLTNQHWITYDTVIVSSNVISTIITITHKYIYIQNVRAWWPKRKRRNGKLHSYYIYYMCLLFFLFVIIVVYFLCFFIFCWLTGAPLARRWLFAHRVETERERRIKIEFCVKLHGSVSFFIYFFLLVCLLFHYLSLRFPLEFNIYNQM